jgi:hypothetical protein
MLTCAAAATSVIVGRRLAGALSDTMYHFLLLQFDMMNQNQPDTLI